MTHTPGPWLLSSDGRTVCHDAGDRPEMPGVPLIQAIARTYERTGESDANARLIAAAPDLLSACKAALAEGSGVAFPLSHPTLNELRAAITTAEGR